MKRKIITISGGGIVTVPNQVSMNISEIAGLFDIYYRTAKRHIRSIEKSGVAGGDYKMSGTVEGAEIRPDYYGLEVVIALAFRIHSKNAKVLREWIIRKVSKMELPEMLIIPVQNPGWN